MADLEILSIRKSYKKTPVLTDATLREHTGQCIGVLGKNGSGKSTLLEILAGITPRDGGSFSFMGKDLFGDRKARAAALGYVPQGMPLFEELTARDHLRLCGRPAEEILSGEFCRHLGVERFLDKRVGQMSGGMKKRLEIAMALSDSAPLLLLDEPSLALDLPCKAELHEDIAAYTRSGGTVLLVTHDLQEIAACDTLYILREGELHSCPKDEDLSSIAKRMV